MGRVQTEREMLCVGIKVVVGCKYGPAVANRRGTYKKVGWRAAHTSRSACNACGCCLLKVFSCQWFVIESTQVITEPPIVDLVTNPGE